MTDIFKNKNIPAVIIIIIVLAIGLFSATSALNSYQANNKLSYLLDMINKNVKNSENQEVNNKYVDEFSLLSNNAKKYYNKLGLDRVTGTPTWLINGIQYKGFNVMNKLIPGFNISEGFNDIVLFSSPTCGYCNEAVKWLELNNFKFVKVCAPINPEDYYECDETYVK